MDNVYIVFIIVGCAISLILFFIACIKVLLFTNLVYWKNIPDENENEIESGDDETMTNQTSIE